MVARHKENKDLYLKIRVDVSGVHQKSLVSSHHYSERPGSLKSCLDCSLSTRFHLTVNYECFYVSRKRFSAHMVRQDTRGEAQLKEPVLHSHI